MNWIDVITEFLVVIDFDVRLICYPDLTRVCSFGNCPYGSNPRVHLRTPLMGLRLQK